MALVLTTAPPALLVARSLRVVLAEPRAVPPDARAWVAGIHVVALTLVAAALAFEFTGGAVARGSARAVLGRAFVLLVAAWVVTILGQDGEYAAWRVDVGMGTALALHAAFAIGEPALARRVAPRVRRVLWIVALDGAAALLLAEFALRAAARASGLHLLQSEVHAAAAVVAAAHLPPYGAYNGSTLNGRGFADGEFGPRVPGRARVLAIGDSFSTGAVPWTHHYTSVAERQLEDVEILNVGVPRIGPHEYLHLYRHECADLDPDLIVVAVFVGNDVEDAKVRREGRPGLVRLLDRRYCLVSEVPRRLWRLRGAALPALQTGSGRFEPLTAEMAEARMPHLCDPFLEAPAFGESAFRRLEAHRAGFHERVDASAYAVALEPLLELRRLARPVPVAVLILPDEYQVEDAVWRDVCEDLGHAHADRDRPQRELALRCDDVGLPYRDVLPSLRAVGPLADGRRRLYHLRDTHFNARGNAVVGRELAQLVRAHLPQRQLSRR